MNSKTIRTILNVRTGNDCANSDAIKAKIESGEITGVRFGCGDNVNAIYATFDTYEEALEEHEEDVKEGTASAIEVMTTVLDAAKSDYEERGHINSADYGIEPHNWIDDAIEEDWGAEEIEAQAKKDAEEFNWVCLINADEEADRDDYSQICMIY